MFELTEVLIIVGLLFSTFWLLTLLIVCRLGDIREILWRMLEGIK